MKPTRQRATAFSIPDFADQLCDAILSRLAERPSEYLPSKQVVEGSNPFSRSNSPLRQRQRPIHS
jgi:hypothetical protein